LDYVGLATTFNNLANVYSIEGRLREAEGLYKEAIEIQKKKYGLDYVDLAVTFNNLASVYLTKGRLREAEGLYK